MAKDSETVKEANLANTPYLDGSLAPDLRRLRSSEDAGPRFPLPVPPPRDIHSLEGGAKSPPFAERSYGFLDKVPWQVRAVALTTVFGPPTASLILLAVEYFGYWRAITPFNLADFLGAFFLFAIPVGYVYGAVPALLAASLYCALLTANSRLLQRRPLIRAAVAATCGALASGVWFWELRIAWGLYALVGALVMTAVSPATDAHRSRKEGSL